MVGKASGDIANSGNILKLEVADGKVSVTYSDIARYSTGDSGEQTDGNSSGGDNQGNAGTDLDHSLGDSPESERISEEYFEVKDCADGIFIEFYVPTSTWQTRIYIDGVGQVAEESQYDENTKKAHFFYPFLEPGKEYTLRLKFLREEDYDKDGWNLGYVSGDGSIGWFETKVKAGANSKGEMYIEDFGEIKVEKNGDFTFTKGLKLKNGDRLPKNWILGIGLCEGVSWMYPNRKNKWMAELYIPNDEVLNKKYNFYTYHRNWGDVTKVDFILYRPRLDYEYNGEVYNYLWDGETVDTNCTSYSDLSTLIDITKSADVAKIQGTWTRKSEYDDLYNYDIRLHYIYTDTYIFAGNTVKNEWSYTYTKLNGSAFTNEELYKMLNCDVEYKYDVSLSEIAELEKKLAEDATVLKFEKNELPDGQGMYNYTIYRLSSNCTISSDRKTLTVKYDGGEARSLSEYFADRNYDDGETRHYSLRLFEDGSALRIITSRKYGDGTSDEWDDEYKKQ